jgi:hypothetical protein
MIFYDILKEKVLSSVGSIFIIFLENTPTLEITP